MANSERDSETVSFRLGGAQLARLTENAAERGMSRGEYARQLVVAALEGEHHFQQLAAVQEVRTDLANLRSDLAATLHIVLTNLTDAEEADVKTYLAKHLRR